MKKLFIYFIFLSQIIFANTPEFPWLDYEVMKDLREKSIITMATDIVSNMALSEYDLSELEECFFIFIDNLPRIEEKYGALNFDSIQNSARTLTLSAPIELQQHNEYIYFLTLSLHIFKIKKRYRFFAPNENKSRLFLAACDFLDKYLNIHLNKIIEDLGLDRDDLDQKRLDHTKLLTNR